MTEFICFDKITQGEQMRNFIVILLEDYAKHKMVYNLIILTSLVLCSMIAQYMSFFVLVAVLIMMLKSSKTDAFAYLGFLSSFSNVIRMFDVEFIFISVLSFYSLCLLICMIKEKKFKFNWFLVSLIITLVIYMLLPIGEYNYLKFGFVGIIILSVVLPSLLWQRRDEINFRKIIYVTFCGLLVSVFISFFVEYIPNANQFIERFYASGQYRFQALYNNPNFLSGNCIFLISIFIFIICKSKSVQTFDYFCLIVMYLIGFSTLSKGFSISAFLTLIVLAVVLYFKVKTSQKYRKYLLYYFVALISFSVIGVSVLLDRIPLSQIFDLSVLTTERTEIWKMAFNELISSPLKLLFGLGLGSKIYYNGVYYAAHSSFIDIVYKLGLLGGLLILSIIITSFVIIFKQKNVKFNLINYFPVFMACLYSTFSTTINVNAVFLICMAFAMIGYDVNEGLFGKVYDFKDSNC